MKLLVTDTFPTMEVTTTQGAITLPDEYAGYWFVFFSRPGIGQHQAWIQDHLEIDVDFPIIDDKDLLVPPSTEFTAAQVAELHVTQLSDWFRYRASA